MPAMPRGSLFDAQDAKGNNINLLNDETPEQTVMPQRPSLSSTRHFPSHVPRSSSSSLNPPELIRSNSYDSHDSGEPKSPFTPSNAYEPCYSKATRAPELLSIYPKLEQESSPKLRRPVSYVDSRATSYDEDPASPMSATGQSAAPSERPAKRYPCRFAEKYQCTRTFTTSGHASRHSKIHTAEKSVACSWAGCTKKFTRADNMKQHLETHNKAEKSRHGSGSGASSLSSRPSAGSRRTSTVKISGCSSGRIDKATLPASPGLQGGPWETQGSQLHLPSRPHDLKHLNGLDLLSLAAQNEPSR